MLYSILSEYRACLSYAVYAQSPGNIKKNYLSVSFVILLADIVLYIAICYHCWFTNYSLFQCIREDQWATFQPYILSIHLTFSALCVVSYLVKDSLHFVKSKLVQYR